MARPRAYKGHNPRMATRALRFLSTLLQRVCRQLKKIVQLQHLMHEETLLYILQRVVF